MTTLTESFDTANSATLGPNLAWTDVSGDFQVVSNKASPSAPDAARYISVANSALSSADHYCQVVVVPSAGNVGCGPLCRSEPSDQTHYYLSLDESTQTLAIIKTVAASNSTLDSKSFTVVAGNSYTLKIEAIGTAIKGYVNGAEELSVTDSELSTQVRCGMRTFPSGGIATFDDFVATDELAVEVQLLAPIQDISAGPWLTSSGSPAELWQMIDGEESPDFDYDYTTSAGTMEVKFAPGSTPSVQTGHTLRYRLRGNGTCDALVKLKQGTTVLAQWTETNVPAVDTDYEHTLDSSPSFTITDYTDLRISVEAIP
jgi:hypothetical protein